MSEQKYNFIDDYAIDDYRRRRFLNSTGNNKNGTVSLKGTNNGETETININNPGHNRYLNVFADEELERQFQMTSIGLTTDIQKTVGTTTTTPAQENAEDPQRAISVANFVETIKFAETANAFIKSYTDHTKDGVGPEITSKHIARFRKTAGALAESMSDSDLATVIKTGAMPGRWDPRLDEAGQDEALKGVVAKWNKGYNDYYEKNGRVAITENTLKRFRAAGKGLLDTRSDEDLITAIQTGVLPSEGVAIPQQKDSIAEMKEKKAKRGDKDSVTLMKEKREARAEAEKRAKKSWEQKNILPSQPVTPRKDPQHFYGLNPAAVPDPAADRKAYEAYERSIWPKGVPYTPPPAEVQPKAQPPAEVQPKAQPPTKNQPETSPTPPTEPVVDSATIKRILNRAARRPKTEQPREKGGEIKRGQTRI